MTSRGYTRGARVTVACAVAGSAGCHGWIDAPVRAPAADHGLSVCVAPIAVTDRAGRSAEWTSLRERVREELLGRDYIVPLTSERSTCAFVLHVNVDGDREGDAKASAIASVQWIDRCGVVEVSVSTRDACAIYDCGRTVARDLVNAFVRHHEEQAVSRCTA